MTFPFAARTNAPNTRAASMEPLEVLLSTHNPQVDKLLGGGFPCKGFVELLTTGERRGEISLLIHALAHVKRVVWILPPQGFTPYAPAFEAAGIDLSRQLFRSAGYHPKKPFAAPKLQSLLVKPMLLLHGLRRSLETKTGARCRASHLLVLLEMLSYSAFAQLRLRAYR